MYLILRYLHLEAHPGVKIAHVPIFLIKISFNEKDYKTRSIINFVQPHTVLMKSHSINYR